MRKPKSRIIPMDRYIIYSDTVEEIDYIDSMLKDVLLNKDIDRKDISIISETIDALMKKLPIIREGEKFDGGTMTIDKDGNIKYE